ncbi:MAG: zinc ABC transporter substrate-binding protein [Bacteriovorax sp.]|nr:zinc ABC transporter substrate-binding protein [Bacteriovorax sp.]
MINQLSNSQTESLVSISGDPHEYEPSTMEIKKLISAPVLITGPSELNPWIKKINFQRSKISNLKTVSILFDQKDYHLYPGSNGEALSHFWLYPKVYCLLKNKLEVDLKKLGYALKKNSPCDSSKPEEQLRSILTKIKKPIILTHDALLPLFLNMTNNQSHTIVAIKGSGHHEEANPESIKKMYNALDAPQVIWIQETGINIPQNIINKIRANDIVIKIDTANSKENEPFSVISELTQKLTPFAENRP